MERLNGFGVSVYVAPTGEAEGFVANGNHYVAVPDRSEYTLRLSNYRDVRADAEVKIDGGPVGQFVVFPHSTVDIERPVDVAKKFTFFAESSREAREAGIFQGAYENGLISVTFKPEKPVQYVAINRRAFSSPFGREEALMFPAAKPEASRARSPSAMRSASVSRVHPEVSSFSDSALEGGATLLGEDSWQRFAELPPLRPDQIDQQNITTIVLRLVARRSHWTTPAPPPYTSPYLYNAPPAVR